MIIYSAQRAWPAEPGQKDVLSKDLLTSAENKQFSAHHCRIAAGGEFYAHSHERETELHFVISGRGLALDGGEWREVGPGDVIFCAPGEEHGLRNHTKEPWHVLCVFTPPLV